MIMHVRRLIYRLGFRPRPGSIFYSPSLAHLCSWQRDAGEADRG
jgi:hypothetical protein